MGEKGGIPNPFALKTHCPQCNEVTPTVHKYENTPLNLLSMLAQVYFLRFYSLLSMMVLNTFIMKHVFTCEKCSTELVKGSFFYVAWKRGRLIVPESVYATLSLGFAVAVVMYFRWRGTTIEVGWGEYSRRCGKEAIFLDFDQSLSDFSSLYHNAYITWEGTYTGFQTDNLLDPYELCLTISMQPAPPSPPHINLCGFNADFKSGDEIPVLSWGIGQKVRFSGQFDHMGTSDSGVYLKSRLKDVAFIS